MFTSNIPSEIPFPLQYAPGNASLLFTKKYIFIVREASSPLYHNSHKKKSNSVDDSYWFMMFVMEQPVKPPIFKLHYIKCCLCLVLHAELCKMQCHITATSFLSALPETSGLVLGLPTATPFHLESWNNIFTYSQSSSVSCPLWSFLIKVRIFSSKMVSP